MHVDRRELLAESGRLLRLAWPVMLTSLNWTLLHLIDVAVVGQVSTAELGKLAAGRSITFISIVMGLGALTGVLVFSSRADGARQPARTGDHLREGVLYALVLAAACAGALMLWAEPLVRLIGVAPEMAAGGAAVVRAMALSYPTQFVLVTVGFFLEGVSRPRRVMAVNLSMLPLNAVLAWAWTGGHLGLPAMGAVGAMLATALVSCLGAAAILAAAWTLPDAVARGVRDLSAGTWRRAVQGMPALARFGLVPAIASGLEIAGFSYLIALSTQLGMVAAGAFQTVFSMHNFTFALGLGLASAAGVRVGNAVGAGERDRARPRALLAAALAVMIVGVAALLCVAAPHALTALFSDDIGVRTVAAALLAGLAPWMLFDAGQVVFVYALRSLGDQVAAGLNGIVAFFLVTGGLGWWLVDQGWGPMALVHAAGAGMLVAAILQGGRFWWVTRRGFSPRGRSAG